MRLRCYDPVLGRFVWREAPETDEQALRLLGGGYPDAEHVVGEYREWRELGASVAAALLRAGEEAEARQKGKKDA